MSETSPQTAVETTSYVKKQDYSLDPGKNLVTITLISEGASFSNTTVQKTLTYGIQTSSEPAKSFTVYSNGEWVLAKVETQYLPQTIPNPKHKKGSDTPKTLTVNPPSYCHIYFKPQGSNWLWSTDAQTADNPTIFAKGQGEHDIETITIQCPTAQNPNSEPATLPNLNSELVFLLDKNTNGNMLFRGNEPLGPGESGQQINFQTLHNCLKSKYQLQTGKFDFPEMGKYVLRDIAFLDHVPTGELPILMAEISSFGATEASKVHQKWFPSEPGTFSGMKGQVANWNVEPSNITLDVQMVENLTTWVNSTFTDPKTGKVLPVIYYIHCSSGHDRTGMISSGYLMKKYGLELSEAYILGTTIHKLNLNYGGNLVVNCEDIYARTTDPDRSRCFVAGSPGDPTYNNAIVSIYESLNNVASASLSTKAVSGDPAIGNEGGTTYAYSNYPWDFAAIGIAVLASGVIVQVDVLNSGFGYTQAPTVTIEAPSNGGMQATATAQITDGKVTGVIMTNQGSGYDFSPQVTFSSPSE